MGLIRTFGLCGQEYIKKKCSDILLVCLAGREGVNTKEEEFVRTLL